MLAGGVGGRGRQGGEATETLVERMRLCRGGTWSRPGPLDLGHSPLRGSAQAKGAPITMQLGPGHRGGHWSLPASQFLLRGGPELLTRGCTSLRAPG